MSHWTISFSLLPSHVIMGQTGERHTHCYWGATVYRIGELFAGVGGMTLDAKLAGLGLARGDIDVDVCQTLEANLDFECPTIPPDAPNRESMAQHPRAAERQTPGRGRSVK